MADESDGWTDLTDGAPQPEVAELESTDPLEELVHRTRGPLLRRLRTPHSAAELAAELDVPVTRLYHHLKVLESAGLIEVVATRRVGAALERRYRTVARSFRVGPEAVRDTQDLARSLASVLDSTRADLVGAVENGVAEDVAVWSLRLRLAEPDRVELVERLDALLAEFRIARRRLPARRNRRCSRSPFRQRTWDHHGRRTHRKSRVVGVYADRDLVEKRIQRELWERVLPLVHPHRQPLTIEAGPDVEHLEPFEAGSSWGAPWATTWFRLSGEIPAEWAGRRVEAVIDLGFHQRAAGFQCEGLVVDLHDDGSFTPLQGIHPRRTNYVIESSPGPITLHVEAASNPMFPQFTPSPLGSLDTAGDRLLYRFRQASLVVVDPEAEALAHDIEVLDGVMRALALDDPRRARLLRTLAATLDRIPDVAAARRLIAPTMAEDFGDAVRHRAVAVGHAHIDTAWLWPIRETKRKCTRTFASAVALMDDYPEYVFAASSAQHYTWIEERHPELFAKIVERVERGQWMPVGGMWVEADMNLPSGESLVRQIVFGQRYFEEKFGHRCTEVWIPDVFGYPAALPQVFAAGGMDRFVTQKLSWNKQNTFPHSTFWWEGLDGTRVLTHFPPVDTYNAEITPEEFGFSITNFKDHAWSTDSLMPFGHGDGGGGPDPRDARTCPPPRPHRFACHPRGRCTRRDVRAGRTRHRPWRTCAGVAG